MLVIKNLQEKHNTMALTMLCEVVTCYKITNILKGRLYLLLLRLLLLFRNNNNKIIVSYHTQINNETHEI